MNYTKIYFKLKQKRKEESLAVKKMISKLGLTEAEAISVLELIYRQARKEENGLDLYNPINSKN